MHCEYLLVTTLIIGLLCFISVPIIPVYLDIDKPMPGAPMIADNSTKNGTSSTASSSLATDSSIEFKIGALFASKAFVQVCYIVNYML